MSPSLSDAKTQWDAAQQALATAQQQAAAAFDEAVQAVQEQGSATPPTCQCCQDLKAKAIALDENGNLSISLATGRSLSLTVGGNSITISDDGIVFTAGGVQKLSLPANTPTPEASGFVFSESTMNNYPFPTDDLERAFANVSQVLNRVISNIVVLTNQMEAAGLLKPPSSPTPG